MWRYVSISLIGCLISAVTACAYTDRAASLLVPVEASISGELSTASVGEQIFQQVFRPFNLASLELDETLVISGRMGRSHTFEAGLLFYQASSPNFPTHLYCASENTYWGIGWSPSRSCLADSDHDGAFDTVTVLIDEGELLEIDGGNLTIPTKIEVPIPYKVISNSSALSVRLAIVLDSDFSGKYFKIVGLRSDGGRIQISDHRIRIPDQIKSPNIIDVNGAKVEIHGSENKVISYKVLNGFPRNRVVRLIGKYTF